MEETNELSLERCEQLARGMGGNGASRQVSSLCKGEGGQVDLGSLRYCVLVAMIKNVFVGKKVFRAKFPINL